jgi:hypothetical protein
MKAITLENISLDYPQLATTRPPHVGGHEEAGLVGQLSDDFDLMRRWALSRDTAGAPSCGETTGPIEANIFRAFRWPTSGCMRASSSCESSLLPFILF